MADERPRVDYDKPPFSRVFVVCSRSHTEEELREAFEEHGVVDDVFLVKDKVTKENKGIAYIKFSKASEAAVAMEKLHGATISGNSKPIKALLADSKSSRDKTDPVAQLALTEDKHRTRIFILVPKSMTEEELTEEFNQYGTVAHVQILKDRSSGESKGCAYVRYSKPSEAFTALEGCDATFKAVIAEPRVPKNLMTTTAAGTESKGSYGTGPAQIICPTPQGYPNMTESGSSQRLTITCHTSITQHQLTRLFDICPGLVSLDLHTSARGESRGIASATYSSVTSASFARNKLNNIEYPPTSRLTVTYKQEPQQRHNHYQNQPMGQGQGPQEGYRTHDYGYQTGGYDGGAQPDYSNYNTAYPNTQGGGYQSAGAPYQQPQGGYQGQAAAAAPPNVPSCPYTDVALPGHQAISNTTHCRAKLFFVAAPTQIPEEVLSDVFCRFSDLIDIQIIQGTAYGYIRYSMKESADAAKMLLDGATIAGSTIRLSYADNTGENKRAKLD